MFTEQRTGLSTAVQSCDGTLSRREALRDMLGRPLKNLRLSVTDRCNLRCSYCMPEAEYVWLPRHDILQFEEMSALVDVFVQAGVDRIRLTGGEPLLRRDLPELIRMIAGKPAIRDLALTTNGVMLADQARALHDAGLHRLTVSLDTLRPDRFQALTRLDALPQVLAGIDEAAKYFAGIKLDSVVIRGTNEDELVPLLEYARRIGAEAALHRIHGRRRRDAMVARARDVTPGDAGGARSTSTAPSRP